ncbi:MAG TPA: DUF5695 domain-containing protein [Candidatus Acidoferrales bacterium]|nr:DUF5695 domain-containing protein [Candidatus Acidoferrales bacterium]
MKHTRIVWRILLSIFGLFIAGVLTTIWAQKPPEKKAPLPGPMLDQGTADYDTPDFTLSLVKSSQTVAALKPKGANGFDFTPGDLLPVRSQNGYFHLGDITLRLRTETSGPWANYSTAAARAPVRPLARTGNILASSDLAPTLPENIPLQITRTWTVEGGKLVLRFELKNKSGKSVQIGALGIPMIFNNVLNGRSLEQAHAICSFYDPYIGKDAGYLQVTRLNGHGPVLLVLPEGKTPFEAYNPILDHAGTWGAKPVFTDPTPRGITFEGFYEWMVHSQAYAENEWNSAQQWNPPTGLTLEPKESKSYGLKFVLSDTIRHIEKTLAENQRPVAVGIPGYVLPLHLEGRLFLKYNQPVRSLKVEPTSAIEIRENAPTRHGQKAYTLLGKKWGRSRVTVTYADGTEQTIQYFVIKPEVQTVADMGRFLTTRQWFNEAADPFHRAPSPISYDREANQYVLQDSRVWIAGLSDEGGAGSWLAAVMKEFVEPEPNELAKIQLFIDGVLWGQLQSKDGPHAFGVRKSLFFYQPEQMPPNFYNSSFDWTTWTSWNRQASEQVNRSYDYPHVAAAYWVLYRLARNHTGLVTNHGWDWYLNQAYETSMAMPKYAKDLSAFGQMEGSIFVAVLKDLEREGWTQQASALEGTMRMRANRWKSQAYPFGSEMPWDSTGQEEVYAWTKYFGYDDKAEVTLNAILGYDPTIPHWGYNGSARRYWDFIFAAKDRRLERQLHHYGSGLNAIPLLSEFREHPDDFYLLRVGYGGTMGALTDIDEDGFASVAFHAFPDMLKHDPYSGDYGPNFFGHAWNTATYLVEHPEFGWLAFGGNVRVSDKRISLIPLDSYRQRVFLAPLDLWLTLDAGKFEAVELDSQTGKVRVGLSQATKFTPAAKLRVEQPDKTAGASSYRPGSSLKSERGAYVVPLGSGTTWVELTSAH